MLKTSKKFSLLLLQVPKISIKNLVRKIVRFFSIISSAEVLKALLRGRFGEIYVVVFEESAKNMFFWPIKSE